VGFFIDIAESASVGGLFIVPLPIPAEINWWLSFHRQTCKAAHLCADINPAVIFTPWCLLRVAEQILASDMMMVADFGAAHTAEKFLGLIRASAVQWISFLVIDPLHLITLM
jgi:hypothetical protein